MSLEAEALETLKNAAFPVYAIPPSEWRGDVMVGGAWGSSKHPLAITLRYDEDLGKERPREEIEIVSTGREGLEHRSPQDRELGWEFSYANQIINFTHPFSQLEERPVAGSERFNADMVDGKLVPKTIYLPSAGLRRLAEPRPFRDAAEIEPVTFELHPEFRCYRIAMPEVEVFALSWGYEDQHVTELLGKLRPIKDNPELFAEMERAEYAAWQHIRGRKGWTQE